MRYLFVILSLLCCISLSSTAQNTPSPESYLGYKVGTKFTRHHQVVDYFKALAKTDSTKIKVEKYGETYEGRELMLAFISSAANIEILEKIKHNNIALTGANVGKQSPLLKNPPAIVWLSYNVHGNEPASTEAAMLTAYELLNPSKKEVNDWLQNTIVIIDPCLNPDGRDRYVNWYNTTVGKNYNADAQSREHGEVYPQGRTNHYNFDLNRDWAWQTQAETKFRIKKYLEWMPHVHVDFHEQGYDAPYYFAPAAEPMHNIITPWQKEFQTKIGKNHSKYFDENGWLYFTKQIFDLFYPSYGDTYPTYNGSVGMTYEQGGIAAGLGVNTNANEILTLTDRVMHHVTTSLSTIETTSKNSSLVIDEFKKYFTSNRQGLNADYQTYIVTSNDENKVKAVADLLQANGINYGKTNAAAISGYSYANAKTENVEFKKYSIAVSTHQPRGSMVTVLFEPNSKLSDSATYDITAWSLPYVYGVDAYATKGNITINNFSFENNIKTVTSNYGVVIPHTSFSSSKLVAYLLKNGVKIRIASKPFTIDGNSYKAGTVIVLKNGNANADWNKIVNEAAAKFNIQPVVVSSGFVEKGSDFGSADVKLINAPRVALLTGVEVNANAAGEVWSLFDNQLDYPVSLVNADKIGSLNLKKYDVIIMPDGGYRSLNDKSNIEKIKDFVRGGGRLIAIQDAVNTLAQTNEFDIKNKTEEESSDSGYSALLKYENRERDFLPNNIPGAVYKVELDNTHPLAYGYDKDYYTLKLDANIYEFMKDGWNVGVLKKSNYVAGFRGFKVGNKLKDGTLFGVSEMGNGSVVFLADNPLFRLFWENGKQLFCNAVFMPN